MMNTTLSAATGGLTVFLLQFAITRKYDLAALCNGILAGLVSITAGCSNVESGSAVLIAIVGGCVVITSSRLVKKAKIDDPVDAFSVHGACGIWGTLAAAIFDFGAGTDKHHGWGGFSATSWTEDGEVKYMTTGDALQANVTEIVFVIAWSGGLSAFLFGALRVSGFLRVDSEHEDVGCDSECASPKAYNLESPSRRFSESNCSASPKDTQPEAKSVWSATTVGSNADESPDQSVAAATNSPPNSASGDSETAAVEVPISKDESCEASPPPPVIPVLEVPAKKEKKDTPQNLIPALQVPATTQNKSDGKSSALEDEGIEPLMDEVQDGGIELVLESSHSEHIRTEEEIAAIESGFQNQDGVKMKNSSGCVNAPCVCLG
jgi:hypothetical protein